MSLSGYVDLSALHFNCLSTSYPYEQELKRDMIVVGTFEFGMYSKHRLVLLLRKTPI